MLGTDVGVVEPLGLFLGVSQHLARPLGELLKLARSFAVLGYIRLADHRKDLPADLRQRHTQTRQHPSSDALSLLEQAEQQMLGTDVVMVELPSLPVRQRDNPLGTRG